MFKSLCFYTSSQFHMSKEPIHHSTKSMDPRFKDITQLQPLMLSSASSYLNPVDFKSVDGTSRNIVSEQVTELPPAEFCTNMKPENNDGSTSSSISDDTLPILHIKKTQSEGSMLDGRRITSYLIDKEWERDQFLSSNSSSHHNLERITNDSNDDYSGSNSPNPYQESAFYEDRSVDTNLVRSKSFFSIGDPIHFEGERRGEFEESSSSDYCCNSSHQEVEGPPVMPRSNSLPNLLHYLDNINNTPFHGFMGRRTRSFVDVCTLDGRIKFPSNENEFCSKTPNAFSRHDMSEASEIQESQGGYLVLSDHSNGSCEMTEDQNCVKDETTENFEPRTIIPVDPSPHIWDEDLACNDLYMKRMQDWIHLIDIESPKHFLAVFECSNSSSRTRKVSKNSGRLRNHKVNSKFAPDQEVPNYICSLYSTSTSARMDNQGLVTIPFLGTFTNLRVLNLSGNGIARITPGALPRSLHVLNLSKNKISAIEGFRNLTRLRKLDLSYNRISQVRHGLASCSSIRELYLAGNKIFEVGGLHRLQKLSILDLSHNKISTAKCLGQLAANYSSLEAIYLEGNPVQTNVGKQQLKKYLVGFLPYLTYFDENPAKSSSSKDVGLAGRSLRLGRKIPRKAYPSGYCKNPSLSRRSDSVSSLTLLKQLKRQKHHTLPPHESKHGRHRTSRPQLPEFPLERKHIHRSRREGNF